MTRGKNTSKKLTGHWSERSDADRIAQIGFDFIAQLEHIMDDGNISRRDLARRLGVTPGRVSQVMEHPSNLTVTVAMRFALALNRNLALIAYDRPSREQGPIFSEIFTECWARVGKPRDCFELRRIRPRKGLKRTQA